MDCIDLRSDTVTRPTPGMREAMAQAEVGDDVMGEDPTVIRLEETVAALLGKEAALFVPSGTMANQIAVGISAGMGAEFLLHEGAHIYRYEGGAASALWGTQLVPIPGKHGRFSTADIDTAVHPEDVHFPPLRAVSMEITHNRAGGNVWPLENFQCTAQYAADKGLHVHVDGARLWNAAATGMGTLREFAEPAHTVSVCFSKGLGAPVGSALCGSRDAVKSARFLRKRLGGGMRQAGILAAAALYALEHHRDRLSVDHRRAGQLAEAVRGIPGVIVLPQETNIIIVDLKDRNLQQEAVVEALKEEGVLAIGFGATRFRMVTHLDLNDDDITRVAQVLQKVLA